MSDLEQTLARLAEGFTVQDIMVPRESLVCGCGEDSARTLLEEHRDLDVIPIERGGQLVAYLQRGRKKQKDIRMKDVIGDSASLFDLVEVLEGSCSEDRGFCFVLVRNRIAGYVHYSDLNKDIVKLPFFILLENVEHHLVEGLRPLIKEDNLEAILDADRCERAKEKMCRARLQP
jgi:hypothetical protein